MLVLLCNPPVHHYAGVHYKMNPPLGLPILAAVLRNAGHTVSVLDMEALLLAPGDLARLRPTPDAIGFTVTSHNQRGARECIAALRGAGYGGYILLGGPHITLLAKESLDEQSAWGADAWIMGECEGNIVEIVAQRRTGLVQGQPLPINDIPGPLWAVHKPHPTQYMGNLPKVGHPEGIAMWSRGCPHNCTFCGNPVFGHQRIRYRSPERVHEDMAALAALGVKSVFVYDDELVGHGGEQNEWLPRVCERVAPLGLTWKCQGRCNERAITREVLQGMYDAGCRAIMWGVESFSDKVLQAMRKATTEADIWHTLRLAHEVGIGNWLFLMVGNYQETSRDLAYTEAAIQRAKAEGLVQWRQVTVTTPVRGTELYHRAAAEGWLVEQPECGPQMSQVYNATPWLAEREIRYWKARLEAA